jgi:ubiquinone/menaquinone biosynthesis C-methylase UbiE
VLEIGTVPADNSLLCVKSLASASEKVGINLNEPYYFKDITIHKGNSNAMDLFEDERFDLVLCNAMLEHDPFFWQTIDEIKRVSKPGGIVGIGTPGFKTTRIDKLQTFLEKVPIFRTLARNVHFDSFFFFNIDFPHSYGSW